MAKFYWFGSEMRISEVITLSKVTPNHVRVEARLDNYALTKFRRECISDY